MSEELNPTNLEILRMARELAISAYTDKRAEMHNQWLIESEHLWKTQRLRVAYPIMPAHPTEKDIVEMAAVLMEFVSRKDTPVIDTPETTVPMEPPKTVSSEVEEIPPEPVQDIVEKPIRYGLVSLEPKTTEEPARVLPSVLEKIDQMRRGLF